MVTWQQIGRGEPNPFDVTYTQNSTYSASYGELVITEGSQVDLPSPQANEAVAVRSFEQIVTITTPSGNIRDSSSTGKVNLNSPEYVLFVSDGTNWYVQNNESGIGAVIPDDGLVHRYDARELSLADQQSIDPFSDLEGATDLGAVGDPVLDADAINGHAASYYDGADDAHRGTFGSALTQPFVIASALRVRSVDTGSNEFYFEDPNAGARILNNQGDWQIADSSTASNGGAISTGNHIVVGIFDGADSSLRVDGAEETPADLSDGLDGFVFAEDEGGGVNSPISIGAELTYDGLPTISDVESYLSNGFDIPI